MTFFDGFWISLSLSLSRLKGVSSLTSPHYRWRSVGPVSFPLCTKRGRKTSTILSIWPPWSNGSVFDHRSLPPVFESRRWHIWRLRHLWLRFITFGIRPAHLAYHVHKCGCKTPINLSLYLSLSSIVQVDNVTTNQNAAFYRLET